MAQPVAPPAATEKAPPPRLWESSGFVTQDDPQQAYRLGYSTAPRYYEARGRGEFPPAQSAPDRLRPAGWRAICLRPTPADAGIAGEIQQDMAQRLAAGAAGRTAGRVFLSYGQGAGEGEVPECRPGATSGGVAGGGGGDQHPLPGDRRRPALSLLGGLASAHLRDGETRHPVVGGGARRPRTAGGGEHRPPRRPEEAAARGTATVLMPASPNAAYFFLRAVPAGVRGMRVPERLDGEVWVVGWCGRPCPARDNCMSSLPPAGRGSSRPRRGARRSGGTWPPWLRRVPSCRREGPQLLGLPPCGAPFRRLFGLHWMGESSPAP